MRRPSRTWRPLHRSGPAAALCAISLTAQAAPVRAQPPDSPPAERLEWDPESSRFGRGDFATLSLLTATSLSWWHFDAPHGDAPDLRGRPARLRLDAGIRAALRPQHPRGRSAANLASDLMLVALVLWPLAADTAVARWSSVGSSDVAEQLVFIDLLSFTATATAVLVTKSLVRRARPYVVDCHAHPDRGERHCTLRGRYHSFFSGHAAHAFTAASLVCLHHAQLPLYRHDAADAAACGGALLLASTVALLRVVADQHHFTDVVFGALVGFLSGFVMPRLVHYR
jgi:membrane-associated phospholipid phosphatase